MKKNIPINFDDFNYYNWQDSQNEEVRQSKQSKTSRQVDNKNRQHVIIKLLSITILILIVILWITILFGKSSLEKNLSTIQNWQKEIDKSIKNIVDNCKDINKAFANMQKTLDINYNNCFEKDFNSIINKLWAKK